jgi:signal transduction histidine kinase/ActR/RegA family two-component response regulator
VSDPAPLRLDHRQRIILWAGVVTVTLALAATRVAHRPAYVRFFDNVNWTAGYGASALLAATAWWKNRGPARLSFFIATAAYFVGQLLCDVQVAVGWNPFPGPSDIFFSALGPGLALGLALEMRELDVRALWSAGLDLLGLSAAALAYALALYLPMRGESTFLVTATLVAYPVFLTTALGTGVLVVLARRLRVTPAVGLLLSGMLVNAMTWAQCNVKTLENMLGDGIVVNYAFSYAAILLGAGIALWDPREVTSPRSERAYYGLGNAIPVLLAVGAGVALHQSPALAPAVAPWVQSCSLLIVVAAVARQTWALAEREQRLAAERHARILADQYRAALAREQQAQRLESLGTLAAGVAHDFNNLLMCIRGHAELARRDPAETETSWNAILNACARGSQVVRSMLSFGRCRGEAAPCRLALAASVQESLRLLRAVIPSSITFATELRSDTPEVTADPAQVQQILMNLVSNAAHAIGDRPGHLHVGTRRQRLAERNAFELPAGVYAEVVVADDGHGMDEATRQRLFEPFFTTKGPDKGTGMGLAVVHGIVAAAGGTIECESAPGRGARFTILWPAELASAKVRPADVERPLAELLPPPGTAVLVVDDEPEIAQAIARFLQKRGLVVSARYDPLEALDLVRAAPARFAAVVCDLTMPTMRGDDLCRAIVAIAPDLPVILSTGVESRQVPDCGFAGVLVKPYGLDDLGRLLARVVAERELRPVLSRSPGRSRA